MLAAGLLQRGGGDFVGPGGPGVSLQPRPVGYRVGGGGSSLPRGCSAAAPYLLCSRFLSSRPRDSDQSETTRVASRP